MDPTFSLYKTLVDSVVDAVLYGGMVDAVNVAKTIHSEFKLSL